MVEEGQVRVVTNLDGRSETCVFKIGDKFIVGAVYSYLIRSHRILLPFSDGECEYYDYDHMIESTSVVIEDT